MDATLFSGRMKEQMQAKFSILCLCWLQDDFKRLIFGLCSQKHCRCHILVFIISGFGPGPRPSPANAAYFFRAGDAGGALAWGEAMRSSAQPQD
jgi:hypothetical protein